MLYFYNINIIGNITIVKLNWETTNNKIVGYHFLPCSQYSFGVNCLI